jgi:nucleoid-associated protein YgaU
MNMSTNQTENIETKIVSVVSKLKGIRSEEKVIFSIAAALAVLALLFVSMETTKNNSSVDSEAITFTQKVKPVVSSEAEATVSLGDEPVVSLEAEATVSLGDEPVVSLEAEATVSLGDEPVVSLEAEATVGPGDDPVVSSEAEATVSLGDETVVSSEAEAIVSLKKTPAAPVINNLTQENDLSVVVKVPSFDLVRVEKDGAAIIAGSAKPNSEVRLMIDGKELDIVKSDSKGTFAFITTIPKGDQPMELQLEEVGNTGLKSSETVLVMPSKVDELISPKIIIAEADGQIIVQEQAGVGPDIQPLSLDTINYSASGDVILAGRASSNQVVRVYVDNKPVVLGAVSDGKWLFEIPNIKEGLYTLRVDALDDTGKVIDRVESPFQRVIREMESGQATIQPGFTLWKLAELKYGFGYRYVQIFEANLDSIKDPDLIYPGQIFQIPDS